MKLPMVAVRSGFQQPDPRPAGALKSSAKLRAIPFPVLANAATIKVDGTQGRSGFITRPDVEPSNGNIHVINGVLMPILG
ncbi:fasciclin domain-containing protein [Sphingopyxis sp. RIFCSPHIGHO2_12_FULL_65_19]|uniref:hypothetical protein n=1 Tax=Sphingopyxis sp. RIFCSPHIGHO2_12_FULL_65_19 TaxID=1802172 RepID=UPI0025D2A2D3|nr:hypothetical protein [Sphingopyxis sp. RIFCSPHIGHO2_12_FULL_65_19]